MKSMRPVSVLLLLAAVAVTPAVATNGMNMEAYGPIAGGMGGASFAYDNGSAAVMNNPATLGLGPEGWRLDVALGRLGPDVKAIVTTPAGELTAESEATEFYMPALGLVRRHGRFAYGFGVFAQGGMGTEYGRDSWMADPSMGANTALTQGLLNRTEVSVGRAIAPLTYKVNDKLTIGGTFDFVWAGMDVQMAMSEAQFLNLANPAQQTIGTASGSLVDAFQGLYVPFGGTGIAQLYDAYFDFSNDSDFTGEAMGTGVAGKIGLVYEVSPELSLGATYHSQTSLSDLDTDNAELQMGVSIDPGIFQGAPTGEYQDMNLTVKGKVAVVDFEWPATYGAGAAYQPTEKVLLAADLLWIAWSDVMKDFQLVFTASDDPANGAFAGKELKTALFQNWDDQFVVRVGGSYQATDALVLRAGYNHGANPIPAQYLNPLFPAIVEDHFTLGAGYALGARSVINASVTAALEAKETNPGNGSTIPPVEATHSQLNAMIMFSHRF